MAIFNSYIELPEGTYVYIYIYVCVCVGYLGTIVAV